MQSNFDSSSLSQMRGKDVFDSQREKIGTVDEIYVDDATQQPEWIGVSTGGMMGSKHHLVPVQGAGTEKDGLMVNFTKAQVQKTPNITGEEITQKQEAELYKAYGLNYSERPSPSGLGEGRPKQGGADAPARTAQDTMTRSEEELRIGKRETDTGRVRLRKSVETQPVTEDVELRRERATIERTPIDKPVAGDIAMGDEELEVELHEEEPLVEKRAVAKEEVRLGKETETQNARVQEQVRKERIEEQRDTQHDPDYHNKQ